MAASARILDINTPQVEPTGAPPNDYENIRASPEMFGGLIAQGEEKLGRGLEQAGNDAINAWVEQARMQDQIWGSQAHSDFSNKASPILEKYLTLEGQAAVNARPEVQKQIADLQQQTIDSAPNLYSKMLLSENLRRTTDYMNSRIVSHAAQQTTTWNKVVAQGGQAAATNQGALAATSGAQPDFNYMDAQLRQVDIESHNRYGDAFDLNNPEQKTAFDAEVARDNGRAVSLWVAAKAGDQKDPNAIEHAMQIFERYTKQIDPESRQKISDFITGKGEDHFAHAEAIRLTSPMAPGALHEGANFMRPGAQFGALGPKGDLDPSHLTEVTLSNGQKVTVNKASAPAFSGFLNELIDDGAPIGEIGGYNPRNIAGTGMMSQHAMGNAIDIGSQTGKDIVSSDFRRWVQDNPDKWRAALNRWSIYSGGDWQHPDLGHIEWAGAAPGTWTSGMQIPDAATVMNSIINDPKYAGHPELQDKVMRFTQARLGLLRAGYADQVADVTNQAQLATERARNGDFSIAFPEDKIGLLTPRAQETARLVYQSARREGEFQNAAALAPQSDIDRFTAAMNNNPNPDEAERAKDIAAWNAFVSKRDKELGTGPNGPTNAADPAKYIMAHDPGTQAAFKALDPKNPQSFVSYATAVRAQQAAIGLTEQQSRVLTRQQATDFANAVVKSGDAKATMDTLQRQTGMAWPHVFRDMVQFGGLPPTYQSIALLNSTKADGSVDPQGAQDAALLSRWLREGREDEVAGKTKDVEEKLNASLGRSAAAGAPPPATSINQYIESETSGMGNLKRSLLDSGFSRPAADALIDGAKQLAYAKVYYNHETPGDAAEHAAQAFLRNWQFMPTGSARVPADRFETVSGNASATLDWWHDHADELRLPPRYRQGEGDERHGIDDASHYVAALQAHPQWITSPQGNALWLKDGEGHTVMDKRGNPLSVPFDAPPFAMTHLAPGTQAAIQGYSP